MVIVLCLFLFLKYSLMACIRKMNMTLTVTDQSDLSGYLQQIDGKTLKSVNQSVKKQVNS